MHGAPYQLTWPLFSYAATVSPTGHTAERIFLDDTLYAAPRLGVERHSYVPQQPHDGHGGFFLCILCAAAASRVKGAETSAVELQAASRVRRRRHLRQTALPAGTQRFVSSGPVVRRWSRDVGMAGRKGAAYAAMRKGM